MKDQSLKTSIDSIVSGGFFLIAGPCVVESEKLCLTVAEKLTTLCAAHKLPLVFKASYRKANRLSGNSFSGIGDEEGLRILGRVKSEFSLPILTDIHESHEAASVAAVADILQIPAFLSRQTDLLVAAAETGKWVNVKKGQFLAPEDMATIVKKVDSKKLMLTERGVSFGYRNLVVDFRSLLIMKETGFPVVFDATHSLQRPGAAGGSSTGQPDYIIPMARAAAAVGIDGLFVETHPEPEKALSDAGAMLPLSKMPELIEQVLAVRAATNKR